MNLTDKDFEEIYKDSTHEALIEELQNHVEFDRLSDNTWKYIKKNYLKHFDVLYRIINKRDDYTWDDNIFNKEVGDIIEFDRVSASKEDLSNNENIVVFTDGTDHLARIIIKNATGFDIDEFHDEIYNDDYLEESFGWQKEVLITGKYVLLDKRTLAEDRVKEEFILEGVLG